MPATDRSGRRRRHRSGELMLAAPAAGLAEKGSITVHGPFLDAGDSLVAVTGGTGAYGGAKGEMKLHARDAKGSEYDFIYNLK